MGAWLWGCSSMTGRHSWNRCFFILMSLRRQLRSHEHFPLSSHVRLNKRSVVLHLVAQVADGGTLPAIDSSGGVAERLIAPVLKTGRPKGLVSSNLTPSANVNCRLRIADCGFSESARR